MDILLSFIAKRRKDQNEKNLYISKQIKNAYSKLVAISIIWLMSVADITSALTASLRAKFSRNAHCYLNAQQIRNLSWEFFCLSYKTKTVSTIVVSIRVY